ESDSAIAAGVCSTMLARMARCNSSSVGMRSLMFDGSDQICSSSRFIKQRFERRDIVVPFDQSRNRPESRERFPIERPHLRNYAGAMVVDAQRSAIGKLADGVTGKMNFSDRSGWQPGEIGCCIPTVILATNVDIVDIAQNAA